MTYRFTLSAYGESLVIDEPDGWADAVLKLGRDKDFRSLVEFFDGSFIFYGDNGVRNGGLSFIKVFERTYGPDADISVQIELSIDGVNFTTVFEGQLDLSLIEDLPNNKIRLPIIRDNFWSKFYARKEIPVNLQAATDLDDEVISAVVDQSSLTLPSQIITYYGEFHEPYSITYLGDGNAKLMMNWSEVVSDDIKLFSITRAPVSNDVYDILGLFEAPYDGDFNLEIKFTLAEYIPGTPEWAGDTTVRLRIKKTNSDAQDIYAFPDYATTGTSGVDSWNTFDVNVDYFLRRGEQLVIALNRAIDTNDYTVFGETQLIWKTDVDAATTVPITLSGEQTIDGVATSTSRILVKDQGNPEENGIYTTGAGAWARVSDMNAADEFTNAAVYVSAGDTQSDTAWRQTEEVDVVDFDPVLFDVTDPSDERFRVFPGYPLDNYIKITASTRFKNTRSNSFLIHDTAAAIIKSYGLGVDNPFYSEFFGSTQTNARQYDVDGCAWKYFLLKGLQLRGYTLDEKPFFLSFMEWWEGANPIFNLGLGYEQVGGYTIEVVTVQALSAWVNAGGPYPGSWDFASFGYPFVSVNGGGGPEGYACGAISTVAGVVYRFTTVIEIGDTGSEAPISEITFAILDASFEEISTKVYNYSTPGFKIESFDLSPDAAGSYFAVRVRNDTPTETKNYFVRYALGGNGEQLLENSDFDDGSVWTNEDAGTDWVITGGAATLTLPSGDSKELTQIISGSQPGGYQLISRRTASNITPVTDSLNLGYLFYDTDDNLISSTVDFVTADGELAISHAFTSLVPITRIVVVASINSGADIDLVIPYVYLFGPTDASVTVPESQVIRVEQVDEFYDPVPVVNISNIRSVSRKYDTEKIYKKISIGYEQWQAEDISGIDDPQTRRTYSPKFERIGSEVTVHSKFIAASLAIETTRRQTTEQSTDYKFDNNTFIIAVVPNEGSPDGYTPEFDENFSSVTNLLNPTTRYNIRLSVARNFLRWRKWFNGCCQNLLSSFYRFTSGEGNYDMISVMDVTSPDCMDDEYNGDALTENQNIEITDDINHLTNYYDFQAPLTWDEYLSIRANRKKAIGISQSEGNHIPLFIDELDYYPAKGNVKITGWSTEFMDIVVQEDGTASRDCMPVTDEEACENAITDLLGEFLTTTTGACITA